MMNQSDIDEIVELLKKSVKLNDWNYILEAIDYLQEFQDDPKYEEE